MIFKILCSDGDFEGDYDTIEMAETKFNELQNAGMLPMKVEPTGNRLMKKFDPMAEMVMWVPKIMGG